MARVRKSDFAFDAISLEGSLISPAKLAAVAERKATDQTDAGYHIPKGLTLRDETARYFRIGQALFRELFAGAHPSQQAAIRFTQELLRDVFGFTDIEPVTAPRVHGERNYILTLEALKGRVPVVVVSPADDLDHASANLSHDRRRSAASSLQEWLNAEDNALWGFCCNGERLRLLRDNQSLTRPAFLEANLRQIFENEDFAGFAALWLIVHASRFGQPGSPVTDCALERWRETGSKEGLAARERLSIGVKEALLALGNGFLSNAANTDLRDRLTSGRLPMPQFFNELLRLVYRLIFLLAAEDRSLLHPPDSPDQARKVYAEGYSLGALRDRAIRRSGWDQFHDRWEGLLIVFRALADGEPRLALPALGGLFEQHGTPSLDTARLSNRALMEAIYRLAWLRDDSVIVPVNWRDMETEELGSVYEGLLELTPRLTLDGRGFAFAEGVETKGNERKKTGSYYTPDSLVQALLDSALDPVLDRVESEAEDAPAALLAVTVIDPACGSGHFLLAAARRIATRVARLRTGGLPSTADYRHALRDAVRCCVHGVDRNPMAVELTRVALWIETVEPGKPLGFLDANIRVGDSLLGIFDLEALRKGIPEAAYKPLTGDHKPTAKDFDRRNKRDKGEVAGLLDFSGRRAQPVELPPLAASLRAVRELPEDTVQQVEAKRDRFHSAHSDPRLVNLAQAADLYIAAFLTPKTEEQSLDLHASLVPTTADVWTAMRSGTVYGPRLGAARQLASTASAFHWPLEFPDVMAAGGFDIVLGNPPWERIKIQEQEFFAQREPAIAEAANAAARERMIEQIKLAPEGTRDRTLFLEFELAKRIAEASSEFARVDAEQCGRFPLTGRGDVNTYALFAELFVGLTSTRGRAGIIVPTGIATDATTAPFFGWMVEQKRLAQLIDFENRNGIFPNVHRSFKFSILTVGSEIETAAFAFFLTGTDQLSEPERRFTLSPEQIADINPNSKTAPIFRSRRDAELTAGLYSRVPVLVEEGRGIDGDPWQFGYMTKMFDMADSSGEFRSIGELQSKGLVLNGNRWESGEGQAFMPLYEAKMIHQFDHRWAHFDGEEFRTAGTNEKAEPRFEPLPRYWVAKERVESRIATKRWKHKWLMGWRDITNTTNERTVISSFYPRIGVGHTLRNMFVGAAPEYIAMFVATLCSLPLDYIARQKLGGTHLTVEILQQLPILPPSAFSPAASAFLVPRILELVYTSHSLTELARDLAFYGPPFAWDEDRRALLRAELDAWYARAYGLTRDELRYILDPADVMGSEYPSETFRGLKENEVRRFGEYRTRRLILDAWDRMERGELPAPEPYDQRTAAAQQLANTGKDYSADNPLFGAGPLFETPEITPVAIPAYTAPSTLPDGTWAMSAYNSVSVQLQLAAILKKLPVPTRADKVRLAAVYALHPSYLTPQLSGTECHNWQRLVGDSARVSNAANLIHFVPRISVEWRDAYTQLRGMQALLEDTENDTWAPGIAVQDFLTEGWPDGRAGFVLTMLEGMVIERSITALPTDVQAWVKGYAA